MPFESTSYIICDEDQTVVKDIKEWLTTCAPTSYIVTGQNIITFKSKKIETMFLLRWISE